MLSAPHSQGYLDRLLEHLETLLLRRKRDPETLSLFLVMTRPDTEPGTTAGEDIQRGDGLGQNSRVTEVDPRHHRRELDPLCVGGDERERRVAFRFICHRTAHDRVLPEVISNADAIEPCLLGGACDLCQRRAETFWSSRPVKAVELQSELR